jgi:7,8-dihydropterin-6-yl-methyl-4-(beta-D-ribofuranosyl)aminobenzene 5'-phosphate synthase
MLRNPALAITLLCLLTTGATPLTGQTTTKVTILSDAFSEDASLEQDWGYSALVEHDGKRILFDTGNDSDKFATNVGALGIDLEDLDFVVVSHRHGDHTDGLRHLLIVNPDVRIYVPSDEYFGGPTPQAFFRRSEPALPSRMRYFGGAVPNEIPHGTPWRGAVFIRVETEMYEVMPGVRLVQNISPTRSFGETPELSLVLDTEDGQLVLVGCSHPGIEAILASVNAKEDPVALVVGGLHLVTTPDAEIDRLVVALRDEWRVGAIAPGHCTGEYAFAALQSVFGHRYLYAGVGSEVTLPPEGRAGGPQGGRHPWISGSVTPGRWPGLVPAQLNSPGRSAGWSSKDGAA